MSLFDHYIDHVTNSVPRRRRSHRMGIPVSLAFLAVAGFLWLLAVMPV